MSDTALPLPVDIDAMNPDLLPGETAEQAESRKKHQQHHDTGHGALNSHIPATGTADPHQVLPVAAAAAAAAIATATNNRPRMHLWAGSAYVDVTNADFYVSPNSVDPRAQTGIAIKNADVWIRIPG